MTLLLPDTLKADVLLAAFQIKHIQQARPSFDVFVKSAFLKLNPKCVCIAFHLQWWRITEEKSYCVRTPSGPVLRGQFRQTVDGRQHRHNLIHLHCFLREKERLVMLLF